MLKPDKHMDSQFSIIHVGALIIKALKNKNRLTFDQLLASLIEHTDEKVKAVYLPSLSFLFLLGKIQYHQTIDSIELIN